MATYESGQGRYQREVTQNMIDALNFVQKRWTRLSRLATVMVHSCRPESEPDSHGIYGGLMIPGSKYVHVIDGPKGTIGGFVETIVEELLHKRQERRIPPDQYEIRAREQRFMLYEDKPFEIDANRGAATARKRYQKMSQNTF